MDDFEQFLQQQSPRAVPRDWRREILAAADRAATLPWWRQLLWPSPLAWATVAALWLLIAGLDFVARPAQIPVTAHRNIPAADVAVALAAKRQLLDELAGSTSAPAPHPAVPSPHGQLNYNQPEVRYV